MLDKLLILLLNIKERKLLNKIHYLIFDCDYERPELRKQLNPLEEQTRRLIRFRDIISK